MKKIAIIDSGVKLNHPAFKNNDIQGFSLRVDLTGRVIKSEDFNDTIGHGTAIYYLINKFTIDCEITNIKIYDKTDDIDQSKFETILEYIYKEYNFNIINISMGIVVCGNTGKMQKNSYKYFNFEEQMYGYKK